jgi:putrescine aminotransferase
MTMNDAAGLRARDSAHHLHSFIDPQTIARDGTRIIVRGQGSCVWDADGRRLLDGMAGLWCVNVGYGRQELVEAATRQMAELAYYNNHFQTATPGMIALAERLAGITPDGIEQFYFANSGSEANDTVVRLARHFWAIEGRPTKRTIISRTMAYHGSTLVGSSLGGLPHMHRMDGGVLPGFAHIPHPHWYFDGSGLSREEYGIAAAQALERKILELGPETIAAFIGEPVQGAGGVIDPPASYWPEIQRICRAYDILLVVDEVICGFGRTGEWFGSDRFGIAPDMVAMAKGLSSGYLPIAAVGLSPRIRGVIGQGGYLAHGYTYSGHPVACAVALANIAIIEREGLVDRVRDDIGRYFMTGLDQLAASNPLIGERRGVGLMAALQIVGDKATRALLPAEVNAAIRVRDAAYRRGLIVRAIGQSIVVSPPLIYTHHEVDETIAILNDALAETATALDLR